MKISARVMGDIELAEDQIIEMSSGMIGFPSLKKYALVPFGDEQTPFIYWQCVDDPSLCFVLIDPAIVFPDYEVALPAEEAEELKLKTPADGSVYVVVTIPSDPQEMTVNLMGPLVVNQSARRAKQIVLPDPRYSTKHRILRREAPGHACANSENE